MNQQEMKEENKKKIFSEILSSPGISRIKLARKCSYSKTTVSILVDELIKEGYVEDGGTAINSGHTQGRKPTSLFPNTSKYTVLIVNLDKKCVQIAMADLNTQISRVKEVFITQPDNPQAELFHNLEQYIHRECEKLYILAVCWILPAMIDRENDQLISAVLEERMTDHFFEQAEYRFPQIRHFYFNDTACLAYAEKVHGRFSSAEDFVYINMNDGIGAAFVLKGNLLGGPVGLTTQFGSFSLTREGTDKKKSCLENEIGEKGIRERFLKIMQEHGDEKGELPENFCYKDIEKLAGEGNISAENLLKEISRDISYALGNLITILHVKRIMIGGSGRELGSYFLDCIRCDIQNIGFRQFVENTEIVYSELDHYAVLDGAVHYFLDQCFEFVNSCMEEQKEIG